MKVAQILESARRHANLTKDQLTWDGVKVDLNAGKDDLLSRRPDLKIDSAGAQQDIADAKSEGSDFDLPIRFAPIIGLYVASAALRNSDRGVGKDRNAAIDLMREYETKVRTT